jgi:hypothetical protein
MQFEARVWQAWSRMTATMIRAFRKSHPYELTETPPDIARLIGLIGGPTVDDLTGVGTEWLTAFPVTRCRNDTSKPRRWPRINTAYCDHSPVGKPMRCIRLS